MAFYPKIILFNPRSLLLRRKLTIGLSILFVIANLCVMAHWVNDSTLRFLFFEGFSAPLLSPVGVFELFTFLAFYIWVFIVTSLKLYDAVSGFNEKTINEDDYSKETIRRNKKIEILFSIPIAILVPINIIMVTFYRLWDVFE